MDNLEIMKHAKDYIDKMANGLNPLTNEPVAETDIINNVRITRCLFYVSDVLRQLIEKDSKVETKKEKRGRKAKKDFFLSVDDLNAFAFSNTPIPISEICKRLNDLKTDDGMKQFSRQILVDWLIKTGLLELYTNESGKEAKRPTEQGKTIGISLDERHGMSGTYYVVLYNREAQQFIMDNFFSILEV